LRHLTGASAALLGPPEHTGTIWRQLPSNPFSKEAALRDADRVIGQLYSLDPDGQNFRYFKRRNGSTALDGEGSIDLLAFHEALSSVASFLSASLEVVYVYDDRRREMEAEFSADH
jgi:hypothetical protein